MNDNIGCKLYLIAIVITLFIGLFILWGVNSCSDALELSDEEKYAIEIENRPRETLINRVKSELVIPSSFNYIQEKRTRVSENVDMLCVFFSYKNIYNTTIKESRCSYFFINTGYELTDLEVKIELDVIK